ncbi:MAG: hypothetical protein Kow00128_16510 [Deltaproteobacteria bacterium]
MDYPPEASFRFVDGILLRLRSGILPAVSAALFLLFPPSGSLAHGREIAGDATFREEVVLPKGETWRVLPGATIRFPRGILIVRGDLVVEGTADRPVRILAGDDFEGLDIRGGGHAAVSHAVIEGGRIGANVTGAQARFRQVRWVNNGMGLVVNPYAAATVEGCAFESPERVGILVKRGGRARVTGSRFEGAGKAGIYVFGADNVVVRDSRFERNRAGMIVSMAGARPVVEGCEFRKNEAGLRAEKRAAPEVRGSGFEENEVGLLFSRRAEGRVAESRIRGNGDGVMVEYSSYPVFRRNRFEDNSGMAVRLRNQSSEWEEERGETDREVPDRTSPFGSPPSGREGFRPAGAGSAPGARKGLDGTVDFRDNDWGPDAEIASRGGNLPSIHDGTDEPTFPYKGKEYRMDRVRLR